MTATGKTNDHSLVTNNVLRNGLLSHPFLPEFGTVTVSPVMAVMVKSPVTKSSPVTSTA